MQLHAQRPPHPPPPPRRHHAPQTRPRHGTPRPSAVLWRSQRRYCFAHHTSGQRITTSAVCALCLNKHTTQGLATRISASSSLPSRAAPLKPASHPARPSLSEVRSAIHLLSSHLISISLTIVVASRRPLRLHTTLPLHAVVTPSLPVCLSVFCFLSLRCCTLLFLQSAFRPKPSLYASALFLVLLACCLSSRMTFLSPFTMLTPVKP